MPQQRAVHAACLERETSVTLKQRGLSDPGLKEKGALDFMGRSKEGLHFFPPRVVKGGELLRQAPLKGKA